MVGFITPGRPRHNHKHNFPQKIASDVASKRHLMAHQMKHLCNFSVFHCAEGALDATSRGTPKVRNGVLRDELKNGCGRGWAVPLLQVNKGGE